MAGGQLHPRSGIATTRFAGPERPFFQRQGLLALRLYRPMKDVALETGCYLFPNGDPLLS
jgi:hypothetical protein